MPDIWMDVDTALSEVPVNVMPLIDDSDFKSRETTVAYNAAGMDLVWNFVTTGGAFSQTAVTPTTGGAYDWAHQGDGMYSIEIPASGGISINNDTEGFGWFSGIATGVLPWRGPIIGFRAAALNNALVDGSTIDVNVTAMAAGVITAAAVATGAIDADALATDAVNEIVDQVWDEASTGHTDAGKAGAQLWTDVDAILADTNELQTDDVPALIAALNDLSAAEINAEVVDVLRTDTLPDSYATDGSQPTIAQAILAIHQFLTEKAVSGTTVTVKKPDGSTTAMTFTLDSGTTPTSITRAS